MGKAFINSLLVITVTACCLFYFMRGKNSTVFYGDALGYYLYLPTTFIYNNTGHPETLPKDKGIDAVVHNYVADMISQQPKTATGNFVNQYTYGTAFFELPFFTIAHLYAKLTNKNANGFSLPYTNAIRFSSIVYLLLGLYFLFRLVRVFVDRNTTIAVSCFLLIGTNLFWFSFYQSGMAHMPLFFLYALLLFTTICLHKQPGFGLFAVAGLAAGFITIIRPSEILCLLIPLLYAVYNRATLAEKIQFIRTNTKGIAIAAVCFLLPILPQLIYWHHFTGSYLYDSYAGQSFNFLHPRIIEGLVGFKNGWLAYSPVMFFALAGLFFYKRFQKAFLIILILLPVYVYVIYSWWSYNYINGFGSRPMIHLYPLLAIPFAALLQAVASKSTSIKTLLLFTLLFCCFINIRQSVQQSNDELWSEDSNFTFNLQTLFKPKLSYNDLVVFDCGDKQPKERPSTALLSKHELPLADTGLQTAFLQLNYEDEFLPAAIEHRATANESQTKWMRISGLFNSPEMVYDLYKNHLLVVTITRGDKVVLWESVKINNKIGLADSSCLLHTRVQLRHYDVDQWGPVHFYASPAGGLQEGDLVKVYIWNIGRRPLRVKQLKLELFSQ